MVRVKNAGRETTSAVVVLDRMRTMVAGGETGSGRQRGNWRGPRGAGWRSWQRQVVEGVDGQIPGFHSAEPRQRITPDVGEYEMVS